jgi:simple sugar transport system ATP-binding protein
MGLRDAGCAVLVISEELDELFDIADRLVVMAKGRVSPSIKRSEANMDLIGQWMSGLWTGRAGVSGATPGRAHAEA